MARFIRHLKVQYRRQENIIDEASELLTILSVFGAFMIFVLSGVPHS